MAESRVVSLLQDLIRFDTTNPPGREKECIDHLERWLRGAGIAVERAACVPERPNLIARLPGRGESPPLLFCGHVDVVAADAASWDVPPFEGRVVDGAVWGRGALDMKGGVAMMACAVAAAAAAGVDPSGDIILAIVADEEAGGTYGARFLVEQRPDVFCGVRYAVCEFGGFPLSIRGRSFTLIQVAEKRPAIVQLTARGPSGHGSRPLRGGAMAKLGRVLHRLDTQRLPIHITPATREMIETIAAGLPRGERAVLRLTLSPVMTDRVLAALGETGQALEPLFRNTVAATVVRGGEAPNVIPGEVCLRLDARLLPGQTELDLLRELTPIVRGDVEVRVAAEPEASGASAHSEMFDLLSRLIVERVDSIPVPYILPGSTDGRHLARLGIQTYGFTPMLLPEGLSFFRAVHAANERIPIAALEFGAHVLTDLIRQYEAAPT